MERRQFLRSSCTACAAMAGLGFLLESCGSALPLLKVVNEGKTISVPLARFDELKSDRLLLRPENFEYDLLLIRSGESYRALLMKCTHEGVALTASKDRIYCSAHGSVFNLEGQVLKEPALGPLRVFLTEVAGPNLLVHLS